MEQFEQSNSDHNETKEPNNDAPSDNEDVSGTSGSAGLNLHTDFVEISGFIYPKSIVDPNNEWS